MKAIDFSKVKVQLTFEGQPVQMDMRKIVGNMIHQHTNDIGLDEFAKKLYFSEVAIEVPDEYVHPILQIAKSELVVPAQKALTELLLTNE